MSTRFILFTVAIAASGLGIACWIVARAHIQYPSDAGYFRERLLSVFVDHRHLYTEVEFPYGPALMGLPVATLWLLRFAGGSASTANFVSLIAAQVLGMFALSYAMNRLQIRALLRKGGFIILCAGACVPLLSLNYTHLRFALPLALWAWIAKLRHRGAVLTVLTAGELLEFAISPEIGFAFLGACWAFAFCRRKTDGWYSVGLVMLPALAIGAVLAIWPGYLHDLFAFGRGAFNLPLQPVPPILAFLVAFIWLVPRYVGQKISTAPAGSYSREQGALVAIWVFSIGMLPPTFARCDPLHVFFDGLAGLVLSLAAISSAPRWAGAAWLACLMIVVLWMQGVNLYVGRNQVAQAIHYGLLPSLPGRTLHVLLQPLAVVAPKTAIALSRPPLAPSLDVSRLHGYVGSAAVATPFLIDLTTEEQLRQTGHYRPDFFCYTAGVLSLSAEQRKVQDLGTAEWALVPEPPPPMFTETLAIAGALQGWTFHYPVRHEPAYFENSLLLAELRQHWTPVATLGGYRLYQHAPREEDHSRAATAAKSFSDE